MKPKKKIVITVAWLKDFLEGVQDDYQVFICNDPDWSNSRTLLPYKRLDLYSLNKQDQLLLGEGTCHTNTSDD